MSTAADELTRHGQDLQRQASRFQDLQARMAQLGVTESTPDGRIAVTVDVNGATTAITLAPAVRGMDPATVAAQLMACTRRAQARLRGQVEELVYTLVGTGPAAATITDQYAERFPDPAPEPPQAPPAAPVAPWPSAPAQASPTPAPTTSRRPDRDRIVAPEEPDDEDLYFQRKSWLQ
ncbi:YbaB/EbfC family nucleoid-associated protein [Nocardia rhizosphaerae]|uniref:YbaB/EbfC family nucleoid-associated protein n=1 Tax=Nocardia rhizosphaerae TaxID=1691571 RepID=UPI0036720FC9